MANRDYYEIDVNDIIGLRPAELILELHTAVSRFEEESGEDLPARFCSDTYDGPRVTGDGILNLASADFSEDMEAASLAQAMTIAALDILLRRHEAPDWVIDTVRPLESNRNWFGLYISITALTTVGYYANRPVDEQMAGLKALDRALEELGMGLIPSREGFRVVLRSSAFEGSPEELLEGHRRLVSGTDE